MPSTLLRRFFIRRAAVIAALCAIAAVMALVRALPLGATACDVPQFTSRIIYPLVAAPLVLVLSER